MRKPLVRGIQLAGLALALALLVRAALFAWEELREWPLTIDPLGALGSVVAIALTYLGVIWTWRLLFSDLGIPIRYPDAVRLWSFSNLGRYVPGKVWQIVGLVVVARDLGISALTSTVAAVLSLGFMVSSGALVGMILAGDAITSPWLSAVFWALAAGMLVPIAWPGIIHETVRRIPGAAAPAPASPGLGRAELARFALLQCTVWLGQGVSFFLFVRSLANPGWGELPRHAGAFALAYVSGLVAFFAPGGIGVREGALAALLGGTGEAGPPAHVVAVAARLWAMAGEIVILAIALTLQIRRGRRSP